MKTFNEAIGLTLNYLKMQQLSDTMLEAQAALELYAIENLTHEEATLQDFTYDSDKDTYLVDSLAVVQRNMMMWKIKTLHIKGEEIADYYGFDRVIFVVSYDNKSSHTKDVISKEHLSVYGVYSEGDIQYLATFDYPITLECSRIMMGSQIYVTFNIDDLEGSYTRTELQEESSLFSKMKVLYVYHSLKEDTHVSSNADKP